MVRFSTALILGVVLVIVEAMIVMLIKNDNAAYLGTINQFITVWAMNFFFVYTILTHIKMWHENREESGTQTEGKY
jgi:archaellum biogenesis protein FlaJ (TadC family)